MTMTKTTRAVRQVWAGLDCTRSTPPWPGRPVQSEAIPVPNDDAQISTRIPPAAADWTWFWVWWLGHPTTQERERERNPPRLELLRRPDSLHTTKSHTTKPVGMLHTINQHKTNCKQQQPATRLNSRLWTVDCGRMSDASNDEDEDEWIWIRGVSA